MLHLLIALHKLHKLTLFARVLTGLCHHRLLHFSIADLHFRALAHFGQQKTQTYPALRQISVLLRGFNWIVIMALHVRVFFMPQLVRNLACFGFDHGGWQFEFDLVIQRIKQSPFHHRARRTCVFGLDAFANLNLETGQIFGTELGGQLVIDLSWNRLFHGFYDTAEHSLFTGQMRGAIFFRESDNHIFFCASLDADQLLFEAGNKAVGAQHQRIIFRGTTIKGLTINFTQEIKHDLVAIFGFGCFFAIFKILGVLSQIGQRLINRGLIGFGHQFFQIDGFQIHVRNGRQSLIAHFDLNIVAFFPVFIGHFNVRLLRRTITAIGKMLGHRPVDGFLHCLAQKSLTILLFQQSHWHFALAKALHLDGGLGFGQFAINRRFKLARREYDRIAAFEAFIQCLGDLHIPVLLFYLVPVKRIQAVSWVVAIRVVAPLYIDIIGAATI